MKLKPTMYITIEGVGEDAYFLATDDIKDCEDGKISVYRLVETINKRTVSEIKRPNTTKWFRP